jgi:hypothetical protein
VLRHFLEKHGADEKQWDAMDAIEARQSGQSGQ